MAFTFDISTLAGQVRLYLGDSIEFQGPRPSGINYDDSEIDFYISLGVSLTGSVIAGYMALAGEWSAFALSEKAQNLSYDAKEVANGYLARAEGLRDDPLESIGDPGGFIEIDRKDAYSESETVC